MLCLLKKAEKNIQHCGDEEKKSAYMKSVMRTMLEADAQDTMPWIANQVDQLPLPDDEKALDYTRIKQHFNALLMKEEAPLRSAIQKAKDPLAYAMKLSRCGNYIDFSAMIHIEEDMLHTLLKEAEYEVLDVDMMASFREDLTKAKELLFLCDNCGEIVLDKLLIEEIKRQYPHLAITAMVRGGEVVNDATMVDVKQIHLDDVVPCIDSGIALAGCDLRHIHKEAADRIQNSDLILSKGQANFESLNGSGLPIYYLFLCKCDYFQKRFQMKELEGIFTNEEALKTMFS